MTTRAIGLADLVAWSAPLSAGGPVCIATEGDDGLGLGVQLYVEANGDRCVIRGVEVIHGAEIAARVGWFPAAVLDVEGA